MNDDDVERIDPGPIFKKGSDYSEARKIENAEYEEPPGSGRLPHEPNDATKALVTMLAAFRIPKARIAEALKISHPTLLKYYRHELDNAETIVDAAVLTAWMKNVQAGKEMTILRYMENKYRLSDAGGIAAELPSVMVIDDIPRSKKNEVLETNISDERGGGGSCEAMPPHDEEAQETQGQPAPISVR